MNGSNSTTYSYTDGKHEVNKITPVTEASPTGTTPLGYYHNGSSWMFTTNNIGSVTQSVGVGSGGAGTGKSVAQYTYGPYGSTSFTGTNTIYNLIRYTGGLNDTSANYTHFGQRWLNPSVGAFTQQDTKNQLASPVNGHRYAYANSDPVNNIDPTGNLSCG